MILEFSMCKKMQSLAIPAWIAPLRATLASTLPTPHRQYRRFSLACSWLPKLHLMLLLPLLRNIY